jgi:hypothetical protein
MLDAGDNLAYGSVEGTCHPSRQSTNARRGLIIGLDCSLD